MVTVRVEIMPWLSKTVGQVGWGKVVLNRQGPDELTLGELIQALAREHREFGEAVWHPTGDHVREEATVLVNGRHSDLQSGAETRLRDGDVVVFLPSYAGGT